LKGLWTDADAEACKDDPLLLRVYTSRLLGRDPSLVLHGGGNTSVKTEARDLFGNLEPVIYVKGTGWDLATIEPAGFAPVRQKELERLAELPTLTDGDMVRALRTAMTDPGAPTPSVEAILHAIIPFPFVDHTHADAVVTVSNTADGEARIGRIYGDRVLIVPYVMPGFVLARRVYELTRGRDWSTLDAIILLNHGVFTFGADARSSYEQMISIVSRAEDYLGRETTLERPIRPRRGGRLADRDLQLARLRKAVSSARGRAMTARLDGSEEALMFAGVPGISTIARGTLTPDHVIRTKPLPLVVNGAVDRAVESYGSDYRDYFDRHASGTLQPLDPAPRWAIWPELGSIAFGANPAEASIVADIAAHTRAAILAAESLGGWKPLDEASLFEVEYWELEQAKLRKPGRRPAHEGKVAFVTGAASGIGRACAELLLEEGAAVVGLDINPAVCTVLSGPGFTGLACDVTDRMAVESAISQAVQRFGGLDYLVSNAGLFTPSANLDALDEETWQRSLDLNLSSHQQLLRAAIPFLRLGIDPAVVFIASKNVPAPGPGAGAYSVAKAGMTQLARVAALELAPDGIRVNVIHPHAVFDTGAWTPEVLARRSGSYGISVEEYKARNLLGVEVTSKDVAALAVAMLGPIFAKTTGAQVPVDGGNDRVI
jgi:rhamnose utilization protein RhaD (predicted bifunctional aldolase and dehydrogenase)/NAD(P)-dependent dehydrogenase (short-subunit alcohol dehydrogenase family)